jgi:hypothetical protein
MRRGVGTVKRHLKLHSHDRSLPPATDIGAGSCPDSLNTHVRLIDGYLAPTGPGLTPFEAERTGPTRGDGSAAPPKTREPPQGAAARLAT